MVGRRSGPRAGGFDVLYGCSSVVVRPVLDGRLHPLVEIPRPKELARVPFVATIWACVAEWLRSVSHWGFEWGFLGLALADVSNLRQWSSVGGVLLLSSLVVGASALAAELLTAVPVAG